MELNQVLARLADGARQSLQADAAAVRLLGQEGAYLTVAAASGLPAAFQQEPIAVEHSPLDREALSGRSLVVADAHTDRRAVGVPGDYRSILCVPLVHEGAPLGTLHVYAAAPQRFNDGDAALLSPLVDLAVTAVAAIRDVEALETQEASKAHFIHVATHELRSPVAVAQSLVRGVLKGYAGEMSDRQAEIFGRVSSRLDFLESLVNDLLDLAAGKSADPAEEEAVVLNSSVGRAVLSLQPRAEEKGVTLIHQACCEELVVWGTEEGLDRIFVNLVGNGIKYTPAGGSVTVAMQRLEDGIEVRVIDDGIGIPEEALPHLFQEFYRAPNAKASDEVGTGLGLAIVKDLVDRYHGCIEVESREGQGSTFTVTFPLFRLNEGESYCRLPAYLERKNTTTN
ncbi:MAG: GAF domain-containing sensor histidine kinase [Chloroflexi bacterium]|nr:GAF domain-containing sensor histidine kinase [Chloroflexota bacterium]